MSLRRLFALKSVLVANAVVFGFVGWGFMGEYLRNRDLQREIDALAARSSQIQTKNVELIELGKRLETRALVEREARLKLSMRRPGEQVVVVQGGVDAKRAKDGDAGTAGPLTNAAKWWRYFFK